MTAAHIGYAAMLERFPPLEAIDLAREAELNGFRGRLASTCPLRLATISS